MSSDQHGMGPTAHGPEFAPPPVPAQPPSWQPGQPASAPGSQPHSGRTDGNAPRIEPARPPQNRLATALTIAVIGAVALIVVIATVLADRRAEQQINQPAASSPTPSALPSSSDTSIHFKSAEGEGQLTLVSHRWTSNGVVPPDHGQYLQVELQIEVTDGAVSYGPQFFQSFDAKGELFQTTEAGTRQPMLGDGMLAAGDSITGNIAFDMPRGQVTLLMSNAMLKTVTALKISD
jgi:hypothetical protein